MADVSPEPDTPPAGASRPPPDRSEGKGRPLVKLAVLVALVVGGILVARFTPVGDFLSREGIDRGIALVRGSPWAPALFVGVYGLAMAFALPGSVLTLAGGALFGFWWGLVFNTLGANLGANAAFGLARWLGRGGVERLAGSRLEKLDRATREHGFRGLFALRLVPLVPFNALNFGAGLTAMRWRTYALATAFGIFPGTAVYTMFADALLEGSREASRDALVRVAVSGALLILLSFLPTLVKKLNLDLPRGTAVLLLSALLLSLSVPATAAASPLPGLVTPPASTDDLRRSRAPRSARDLPDHEVFTAVLEPHVHPDDGRVDYRGLARDREALDRYLDRLAAASPEELRRASREERLAFWINAYNACMLRLVVDHYPLVDESPGLFQRLRNLVTDRPENSVWQIPDVFTRDHCEVAGERRSQDEIEHEIIRPMDEPRIHFAVNCAAVSCPVLAAEAYVGDRLDQQLDRQVRRFVDDPRHFRIEEGDPAILTVNRVLDWYGEDFGGPDGIREFFVDYVAPPRRQLLRDSGTRVDYVEYDWTLNDVR